MTNIYQETKDRDDYKRALWELYETGMYSERINNALCEGIRCMELLGKIGDLYNMTESLLKEVEDWRCKDESGAGEHPKHTQQQEND